MDNFLQPGELPHEIVDSYEEQGKKERLPHLDPTNACILEYNCGAHKHNCISSDIAALLISACPALESLDYASEHSVGAWGRPFVFSEPASRMSLHAIRIALLYLNHVDAGFCSIAAVVAAAPKVSILCCEGFHGLGRKTDGDSKLRPNRPGTPGDDDEEGDILSSYELSLIPQLKGITDVYLDECFMTNRAFARLLRLFSGLRTLTYYPWYWEVHNNTFSDMTPSSVAEVICLYGQKLERFTMAEPRHNQKWVEKAKESLRPGGVHLEMFATDD